jgi:hypothetical protein
LTGVWVPHDTWDQIVHFVRRWLEKTEIAAGRFIEWLEVAASKFYDWRGRYGKVREHNGRIPRAFWLEDGEKQAIIGFHLRNPLEGYLRLTFMMLDADIMVVNPSSVWRVFSQAEGPPGTLIGIIPESGSASPEYVLPRIQDRSEVFGGLPHHRSPWRSRSASGKGLWPLKSRGKRMKKAAPMKAIESIIDGG